MQELKFVIKNNTSSKILHWLEKTCWKDPLYPSGLVTSLYYDTQDWHFIREKVNSDFQKTKVRLRWYGDLISGKMGNQVFLEAKIKWGSHREKIRIPLSMPAKKLNQIPLNDESLIPLVRPLKEKGVFFPNNLFPVFQIAYKRFRFIDPVSQARINFDYDIETPKINSCLIPQIYPFQFDDAVFEFKSEESCLPNNLHPLTAFGCKKESFSKYLISYQKIKHWNGR